MNRPYVVCHMLAAMEYVLNSLEKDDFGEFTPDEMYQMIKACY